MFGRGLVSREGDIWVEDVRLSESAPERWLVFSLEARTSGYVMMPRGFGLWSVGGQRVAGVVTDPSSGSEAIWVLEMVR